MRILAIDYGDARTGLAVCDPGELLASPLTTITHYDPAEVARQAAQAANDAGAQRIIVGYPLNMDGSAGPRAQICQDFALTLRELTPLPVLLWDERGTTITATRYLNATDTRGKKRKQVIDAVAATVILESYLVWRKNHPGEEEPHGTL